jgi:hypothetical protein
MHSFAENAGAKFSIHIKNMHTHTHPEEKNFEGDRQQK